MNAERPPGPTDRQARAGDMAVVLPLLGLFLLMPPVITLFAVPHAVFGVPLIVAYLFGVWLVLVLGAALLGGALLGRPGRTSEGCSPPD